MPHDQAPPGVFDGEVVHCRSLCRDHVEVSIGIRGFPEALPGQFNQVLCREPATAMARGAPMLRRPFSIAGLRRSGDRCEVDLLARVVGRGTAWLAARRRGDAISLIGPLGRPFSMPERRERVLLVAGGVGLPPIRWMAEIVGKSGICCECVCGARSRELLAVTLTEEPAGDGAMTSCIREFSTFGVPAAVTTDDGSCGFHGRVSDVLEVRLARQRGAMRVYACGPEAMLESVASICASRDVPCEVALERVMGCGMGTCQSCVVPVWDRSAPGGWRYALCCAEGPVFDGRQVRWRAGAGTHARPR